MQPYGQTQQQSIGLFTFYRQQQQLQKQLKYKIKAQNINNILKKVNKNINKNNDQQNNEIKKNRQLQQVMIVTNRDQQQQLNTQRGIYNANNYNRQITEQENRLMQSKKIQNVIKKRKNQTRLNKSVIEIDNNNKNNNKYQNTQAIITTKRQKTHTSQYSSYNQNIKDNNNNNNNNNKNNRYDELSQYKQFSKYLSQLDMIRLNNKKKKEINNMNSKVIVQNNKQFQQYNRSNSQIYYSKRNKKCIVDKDKDNNKDKDKDNDDGRLIGGDNNNRISVQFKKLALEPQQYTGLNELSKSFVPIAVHRKQKMGLKSYKRQKEDKLKQLQISKQRSKQRSKQKSKQIQKQRQQMRSQQSQLITAQSQQLQQLINNNNNNMNKKSILQSLLLNKYQNNITINVNSNNNNNNNNSNNINNSNTNNNKKIISVHRLSAKAENDNNIRSQSLPRLKINLNDVLIHNNNNKINHINNSKNNNKNNKNNNKNNKNPNTLAISLQLQRSHQLRSKYQIKQVQKQDQNILNLNKRIRSEIKRVRNQTQHQVKHYLSMKRQQQEKDLLYCSLVKDCSGGGNNNCNNNNNNKNNSQINGQNKQDEYEHNSKKHNSPIKSSPSTSLQKKQHNQNQKQLSFNKHKDMFCRKDQFLKNHKDKLKTNIFRIQKSQQTQIKSMMENKKKQIIDNLIAKLSLL